MTPLRQILARPALLAALAFSASADDSYAATVVVGVPDPQTQPLVTMEEGTPGGLIGAGA